MNLKRYVDEDNKSVSCLIIFEDADHIDYISVDSPVDIHRVNAKESIHFKDLEYKYDPVVRLLDVGTRLGITKRARRALEKLDGRGTTTELEEPTSGVDGADREVPPRKKRKRVGTKTGKRGSNKTVKTRRKKVK